MKKKPTRINDISKSVLGTKYEVSHSVALNQNLDTLPNNIQIVKLETPARKKRHL